MNGTLVADLRQAAELLRASGAANYGNDVENAARLICDLRLELHEKTHGRGDPDCVICATTGATPGVG